MAAATRTAATVSPLSLALASLVTAAAFFVVSPPCAPEAQQPAARAMHAQGTPRQPFRLYTVGLQAAARACAMQPPARASALPRIRWRCVGSPPASDHASAPVTRARHASLSLSLAANKCRSENLRGAGRSQLRIKPDLPPPSPVFLGLLHLAAAAPAVLPCPTRRSGSGGGGGGEAARTSKRT